MELLHKGVSRCEAWKKVGIFLSEMTWGWNKKGNQIFNSFLANDKFLSSVSELERALGYWNNLECER